MDIITRLERISNAIRDLNLPVVGITTYGLDSDVIVHAADGYLARVALTARLRELGGVFGDWYGSGEREQRDLTLKLEDGLRLVLLQRRADLGADAAVSP